MKHKRTLQIAGSGAVLLLIAGAATLISRGKTPNTASPEPPEAQVAAVEQRDLPIEHEWIGTLDGLVNADKVNLGFTRLTSLIDGIARVATVRVGNLVGPSSGVVTTVSTLDPIRNNFIVSEQEYLSLARTSSIVCKCGSSGAAPVKNND